MRLANLLMLALAGLLFSAPALAVPVSPDLFTIEIVGQGTVVLDGDDIGCTEGAGPGLFTCNGSNASMFGGDLTLDSWTMNLDADPVVNAVIALTNNTAATQTYVLSVVLPIAPAVTPSSLIGGSIQGGITSDATPGTLSSNGASGNAIYTATIDGSPVATLLDDPNSVSAGAFLSGAFTPASFGTPIPSLAGPAALASIGITLEFTLTPGDSASFTSVFVVEPIPEPGTFALLSLGLVGLAVRRRSL